MGCSAIRKRSGFLLLKFRCSCLLPALIDNADMHGVGVEIDSAVEFVLFVVELHIMFFLERVGLSHEPSSVEAATC